MLKNSPFKVPKLKVYIGKHKFYAPYFEPSGFKKWVFSFRWLKLRNIEEVENHRLKYPHLPIPNRIKYSNFPMVDRSSSRVFFNRLYISWGSPIKVINLKLGWKDKFNSPRFEVSPSYQIWFFKWQIVFYREIKNTDLFWEMYLWWRYYSDCDIEKAEKTWGWVDGQTKLSTWDKSLLKSS